MKVVSESESEENTKPKKSVKRKEELNGKGKVSHTRRNSERWSLTVCAEEDEAGFGNNDQRFRRSHVGCQTEENREQEG